LKPAVGDITGLTLYEALRKTAEKYPDNTALDYAGCAMSFRRLLREIDRCADAFLARGLQRGDSVLLAMPNIPDTVIIFYALNRAGVRAVMTHPLSPPDDLQYYLNLTGSRWAVTMDIFYGRFKDILAGTKTEKLLIAKAGDYLSPVKKAAFSLFVMLKRLLRKKPGGRAKAESGKIPPGDTRVIYYSGFTCAGGAPDAGTGGAGPEEGAVVLFSGGTSAKPKGVLLSAHNFNALAVSIQAVSGCGPGDSMLAILPVFHGFGLGICVHTSLVCGLKVILVPEFSAKVYIRHLIKHKPSFIAGVPTLFQAILQHRDMKKVSFAGLKGAYSGGDSLPFDIKRRFDECLKARGSGKELLEGYGLTECVTACVISPEGRCRTGSTGIPVPGVSVKIADPESGAELPAGETGEICVKGPTVMLGYLNDEAGTKASLRRHDDGEIWLHSGDLGFTDKDGYIFFKSRLKRILKISGVAVCPAQVEQILESHPLVLRACVTGTPDAYRMTSVRAFVVLKNPSGPPSPEEVRETLLEYCKERLIKWAVPRVMEFRDTLPLTPVGKIDYTKLE